MKIVANPKSIAIHSEQSDYYRFRTPYIPKIFKAICDELGINKKTALMDLGCGQGEVSSILAGYAGQVYGIDGSREMIDLATKKANIEYQVCDLNSEIPLIPNKVDHFFFGRSIHWFSSELLKQLATALLAEDGKIVVCSTQWAPAGDWGNVYSEVKNKYVRKKNGYIGDFTGKTKLAEAGFLSEKKFNISSDLKASTQLLIKHTFSTTYHDDLVSLKNHESEFAAELTKRLKTFEDDNLIVMKVTSWAIVYKKANPLGQSAPHKIEQ